MRFNEALYFAFVIGCRGDVQRVKWRESKKYIYSTCHYSDENDRNDYLNLTGESFSYVILDDNLKDRIQMALRERRFANDKYGLPISDEDLRAEDWVVNGLMYIGTRF